jgi:predicted MFS family arabinose efflux permease
LTAVLNLVDRQVITIVVEPIKREFQLSDTQIGLLTGAAFAVFYSIVAFPMARLLDARPRRAVLGICVALWSLSTALASAATSFALLLATRVGVAIGESGAPPAQQSLASDLYPGRDLPMALSLINVGSSIGVALALFIGGWLSEQFGWRAAFFAVGAPGLIVAVLLLVSIPEPPRRAASGALAEPGGESMSMVLRHMASLRSYRAILLAVGASGFSGFGLLAWGPTFLIRVHGMSASEVGLWFGLASALGLGFGSLVSGWVSTVLGQRDIRWYLRLAGAFQALAVPAGLLTAFAPNSALAVLGVFLFMFSISVYAPPVLALVQVLARPGMRGTAAATTYFVQTMVGIGLGPLIIGAMNDAFGADHGPEGVRLSLAISMIGAALAGAIFLLANRWAPSEYGRATAPSGPDRRKAEPA